MQSKALSVDEYLEQVPGERRAALARLRKLCRDTLQDYEEVMEYGMPGYKTNGIGEVGFASQKNYISLYILKQDALAANLPLSVGKGCIRYPKPEKIDSVVVEKLLVATLQSAGSIC